MLSTAYDKRQIPTRNNPPEAMMLSVVVVGVSRHNQALENPKLDHGRQYGDQQQPDPGDDGGSSK